MKDAIRLLLVSGISSAISVMAIGLFHPSAFAIVVSSILAGFFLSWGFVIIYVKAKQIKPDTSNPSKYETLSVSYVNGISLSGAFWIPVIFSFVVGQFGYPVAWVLGGIISLTLIIPILKLKQ
jgi:hypothetical protein